MRADPQLVQRCHLGQNSRVLAPTLHSQNPQPPPTARSPRHQAPPTIKPPARLFPLPLPIANLHGPQTLSASRPQPPKPEHVSISSDSETMDKSCKRDRAKRASTQLPLPVPPAHTAAAHTELISQEPKQHESRSNMKSRRTEKSSPSRQDPQIPREWASDH